MTLRLNHDPQLPLFTQMYTYSPQVIFKSGPGGTAA